MAALGTSLLTIVMSSTSSGTVTQPALLLFYRRVHSRQRPSRFRRIV